MTDYHAEIQALLPLVQPREGWTHPKWILLVKRKYRGNEQFVAGYSHTRLYSHHFSGTVTDRIIGWGETKEAAIEAMRAKLTQKNAAPKGG